MTTRTPTPAPVPAHRAPPASEGGKQALPGSGRGERLAAWRRRLLPGGSPAGVLEHLVLAAVAFAPQLLVERGVVSSDTKSYLYLDPARFLGQVTSMWYPTVALGTVTHQYIGYLFPMGPYYALTAAIHLQTWIAQRLWLGSILFAAGAGVLYLCRTLRVRGPAGIVAALAFMCSPYVLQYSGRISVILMPWAGLPWLVAFTVLALREHGSRAGGGGWRYPALFALVVALTSGINASSVLYVALGPLVWLVWAVAVEREATWRDAGVVFVKLGALSVLVSAWWIAGLVVEAGYGVDILRYTESVKGTSSTSTPLEVLRGLGYWYFYGGGRTGPWTQSVVLYTKWLWLIALSYLVPALALVSGVLVRWRHRGYFVLLTVVGVVLSVGAYPYTHPTAAGSVLKAFMNDTTAGLAMRSTDRATPLVLLGLAMLLGAGVSAAWQRRAWVGWTSSATLCALVLANNPALFNGDAAVVHGLTQPSPLPSYEVAAADYLDSVSPGTRVLAIPGNAFAAYTWGTTYDTPQPALLDRPFVTREQQVMGSMATADTLYAIDEPIQTSVQDWSALAPMARLVSAGDVIVEYDQTSAQYGSVQAVTLARTLAEAPAGLSPARTFGRSGQGVAKPTVDTELLAGSSHAKKPPPVAVYTVRDPRPIARGESDSGAILVAGDATGLETLAAQGLLDTTSAVYYSATLDADPSLLRRLAAEGATLVVTDTNRKQSFRWNGLSSNAGQVETLGEDTTTQTPSSSPIDLFSKATDPTATTGSRTVATYIGAAEVTASSYGNPVTYAPEQRAYSAIDGDPRTAWETGAFTSDVDGQWWQVAFGHTVTTGHVTLVQPLHGSHKRFISKITLTFTGRRPVTVVLGAASRRRSGQRVRFPVRTFRTLRVRIDSTTSEQRGSVGFAEVEVPGQHVVEVDRMPTDLLSRLGTSSLQDRLVIAMTRTRGSPYTTARTDPDMILARSFTLPTARTFTLSGTSTLSPYLADDEIERLVGVPGATGSGIVVTSSSRLTGALGDTAAAAADGNPATIWQTGFGGDDVGRAWLRYQLPSPITFDHLSLDVVADHRHSVPLALTVSADTVATGRTEKRHVVLPPIHRRSALGTTVTVTASFPAVTGTRVRVAFDKVRFRQALLADGSRTGTLPLGIAEIGIPGLHVPSPPAVLPATCQSDLLRIDGRPVTVKVVGSTAAALADGQVSIEPCGADAHGIHLSAGRHVIESTLATERPNEATSGASTRVPDVSGLPGVPDVPGWNVDELTLSSSPGGGPTATDTATRPPAPGAAPRVHAHETAATSWSLRVDHARSPFELVLGESLDAGWRAVATPARDAPAGSHPVTLGPPKLVDAFANGWQVNGADLRALGVRPGAGARAGRDGVTDFTVSIVWMPQRWAWTGIVISGVSIFGCGVLAVVPWRRRRRRGRDRQASAQGTPARRHELAQRSRPPSLALPFGSTGHRRIRWWTVTGIAVVTGGLGAAITAPYVGVALAFAVAAGITFRRVRLLVAAAAVGLLVAAGALVVVGQILHPAPGGGSWPAAYDDAARLAAMAVAFFGADAVVDYATTPTPSGNG
jgi:arabinofuranan 3-O-arabinosyltransferase